MRENDRSSLQTCLRLVQARKIWKSYARVTKTIRGDLGSRFVDFSKLASQQHRLIWPIFTHLWWLVGYTFLKQRVLSMKILFLALSYPDCLFPHRKRKTKAETRVFSVRTLFQIVSLGFWAHQSQVSLDGKHSWWKSTPKPTPREVISPPTQNLNPTATRAGGRRPRPTFASI